MRVFRAAAVFCEAKRATGLINNPFMNAAAHHAVCVLGEPLQREQRVVRLNDHVAHLILVWENRVRLHQLLWVPEDQKRIYIYIIHEKTAADQ